MARGNFPINTFNRGIISELGLARVDLERTRLSAEEQINFVPRTLGSMMLRPGLEYIGGLLNDSCAVFIPFVFSNNDTALIEMTGGKMRTWVGDAVIQRSAVGSSFTNGTFSTASSLTGWADADDAGSTSYQVAGGYLGLVGTRYARAKRRQAVAVASTDANVEHGLHVIINRGRVSLRAGSSTGGDDYIRETVLRPGEYSFGVTPSSSIYVEFSANTQYTSLVDSIAVEAAGDMVVNTTWASSDLQDLRWDASADVTFVGLSAYRPRRVERRATRSWGIAHYDPQDGPFGSPNAGGRRLTPSALNGDITLAADGPIFNSSHVGALFEITSVGQEVTETLTGGDQWTNSIRVTGVDEGRKFQILITTLGSTVGTIRVQRSVGEPGSWSNVAALSFSATVDSTHDDSLDNQIIFYRAGFGSTDFTGSTSDTAVASLVYAAGGITGIAQINTVLGATLSSASVLTAFGSTDASETWSEGDWSGYRGWPSAVALHEGRLFWAGKGRLWGSVSDGYESFDHNVEGDSGPINRSFGSGAVDKIPWLASLGRLIVGAESREVQAKSNSLEEPITPTNFALRDVSQQGSAGVQGVKIDKRVLFIQRGGTRVMEVGYSGESLDYETADRTVLVPEICEPAATRMAVQRQPDTRVHVVRTDGTIALLVSDPAEDVVCWLDIESTGASGNIEDAVVLPGVIEDSVYYVTQRTINGSTKRYLEKWAVEANARGGSSNMMADSFKIFNSSLGSTTVTGADHLVGETVVAWGSANDGVHLGSTFVVSSTGTFQIPSTLATESTTVCYGLPYYGTFVSAKLAYAAQAGTALTQRKRVDHLALVLADTHARGLQYGPSSDFLDDLPVLEDHEAVSTDTVHSAYDHASFEFPGEWNTDSRMVLLAAAPKPVTLLAAVITIQTREKV